MSLDAPAHADTTHARQTPPLRWHNLNSRDVLVLMLAIAALSVSMVLRLIGDEQTGHSFRHEHVAVAGVLDVNCASASELAVIPGVGAITAASIISERDRNGPFQSLADLLQRISRLNEEKIGNFRPYLVFTTDAAATRLMPEK